jgi:trk system potassium uptake protein TrkH
MFPGMTAEGVELRYIDALFTSTSAICVTGLITVDTATVYSPAGKAVIAFLIQIGGLGIMTGASFLIVLLGRRVGLFGRLVIQASLGKTTLGGLVRTLRAVVAMTVVFEGIGALLLSANFFFRYDYEPLRAVGYGTFHAVSAFNNAGFALFSTNLETFRSDWLLSLTVAIPVIVDLVNFPGERRLSLQSKLVLVVSGGLLVLGTAGFWLLQWGSGALAGLSFAEQGLVSFFQGVVPRTAGFNSVPMGSFLPAAVYLTMFLMFVGASPQSTGGGIKTTTFGVIAASIWATARGKHDVEMYERRVPRDQVLEALTLLSAASGFVMVMTLALLADAHDLDPTRGLFEVVSAFGTVGLSLGVTSELSDVGKLIVILTMYVGRVGPLTLSAGLLGRKLISRVRLAEEQVALG